MIAAMSAIAIRRKRSKSNMKVMEPPPRTYICGKISRMHTVMVLWLFGALILMAGLVHLTHEVTITPQRLAWPITGGVLLFLGLIVSRVKCCTSTSMDCINSGNDPVTGTVPSTSNGRPEVPKIIVEAHVDRPPSDSCKTDTYVHCDQHNRHHHHHHHHHHHNGPPPAQL